MEVICRVPAPHKHFSKYPPVLHHAWRTTCASTEYVTRMLAVILEDKVVSLVCFLPAEVYLPESDLAPVKEHLSNLVETVATGSATNSYTGRTTSHTRNRLTKAAEIDASRIYFLQK
eukprot:2020004-Amphidinium_carterae.1